MWCGRQILQDFSLELDKFWFIARVDRAVCMCIVLWKCGVWNIECKVELCMQDPEWMASSLWIPKFTEPHNTLEHAATDHRASIMACWEKYSFFSTFEEGSICINLRIWIYLHEWTDYLFIFFFLQLKTVSWNHLTVSWQHTIHRHVCSWKCQHADQT